MSIEAKIKALSLKTVSNGASEAEAEAARNMIARLKGISTEKKVKIDIDFINEDVVNVDWDLVAKSELDHFSYGEYVNETHISWEKYNKTRLGLNPKEPMSRNEYRIRCHEIFDKLHTRKRIS